MSDLQVAHTKMLHFCLESHEQPDRLNLLRLPGVPCLQMNLKMSLMFDGGCVSFDNIDLFHFLVFIVE